ncbi:hypothetical protein Pelo_13559 [Pelomyxa schiedti]|nr:hypothetical protein Pelo_13559 [Pelomyxa schiedti]
MSTGRRNSVTGPSPPLPVCTSTSLSGTPRGPLHTSTPSHPRSSSSSSSALSSSAVQFSPSHGKHSHSHSHSHTTHSHPHPHPQQSSSPVLGTTEDRNPSPSLLESIAKESPRSRCRSRSSAATTPPQDAVPSDVHHDPVENSAAPTPPPVRPPLLASPSSAKLPHGAVHKTKTPPQGTHSHAHAHGHSHANHVHSHGQSNLRDNDGSRESDGASSGNSASVEDKSAGGNEEDRAIKSKTPSASKERGEETNEKPKEGSKHHHRHHKSMEQSNSPEAHTPEESPKPPNSRLTQIELIQRHLQQHLQQQQQQEQQQHTTLGDDPKELIRSNSDVSSLDIYTALAVKDKELSSLIELVTIKKNTCTQLSLRKMKLLGDIEELKEVNSALRARIATFTEVAVASEYQTEATTQCASFQQLVMQLRLVVSGLESSVGSINANTKKTFSNVNITQMSKMADQREVHINTLNESLGKSLNIVEESTAILEEELSESSKIEARVAQQLKLLDRLGLKH